MLSLVLNVSRWVIRRLVWLLLILAILWAGWLVKSQLNDLQGMENSLQYLKSGATDLDKVLQELENQTKQSAVKLKTAALAQLDQRISELSDQIESKNSKLLELDSILNKINPTKQLDAARLKIQIELATQEREYLRNAKAIISGANQVVRISAECENIRLRHVSEWTAYQAAVTKLASFMASASWQAQLNPFSADFKERESLEASRDGYAKAAQEQKSKYDQCLAKLSEARRINDGLPKEFVLNSEKTRAVLKELEREIKSIQQEVDKHWLKPILFDPLKQVFPIALGILATAIFVPLAIKLLLYFVLAPLATKQSQICLLPKSDANGKKADGNAESAVSMSVEIGQDSELVVLPQYFHSAPDRCRTSSRCLLNNNYTMTSLAAGMYNLTSVHADEPFVVTVSSGQESLTELIQIELGDDEAVSLRPRSLVGVIHKRRAPIRISSHWRLGSLQAWLTMQLRYLVFHGPATIIVKGCRGVRIEPAIDGRAIEQASTIGFSANLNYSTSRTETLMAYLTGQKGLLRDRFSGSDGFYIYEEMPDPSKRSGVTGKGIEGISDAVLKLFGV